MEIIIHLMVLSTKDHNCTVCTLHIVHFDISLTVGGSGGELLLLGVPETHEDLALVPVQLQVPGASLLGAVKEEGE